MAGEAIVESRHELDLIYRRDLGFIRSPILDGGKHLNGVETHNEHGHVGRWSMKESSSFLGGNNCFVADIFMLEDCNNRMLESHFVGWVNE